jgi:hypothetical protein
MEQQFKKGDWCFCEFKLQQIVRVDESRITEVSDGNFSLSSYDLSDKCYPLDLSVKRISDTVAYFSDELHKTKLNLNFPDLNREWVRRWCEMCDVRKDTEKLRKMYKDLEDFYTAILGRVTTLKTEEVSGVRLFR